MSSKLPLLLNKLKLSVRIGEDILRTNKNIEKLKYKLDAKHVEGLYKVQESRVKQFQHQMQDTINDWNQTKLTNYWTGI
tara:strand:- start:1660 stop:1896 length:237 start_codon:yes stop_codon:yes gene_type:complete